MKTLAVEKWNTGIYLNMLIASDLYIKKPMKHEFHVAVKLYVQSSVT